MSVRTKMVDRAFDRVLDTLKEGRSIGPELLERLVIVARLGSSKCRCQTCEIQMDRFLTLALGGEPNTKEGYPYASPAIGAANASPFPDLGRS